MRSCILQVQRCATLGNKDAGQIAGLNVLRVIKAIAPHRLWSRPLR